MKTQEWQTVLILHDWRFVSGS